jgi:acyl-CoA synthetase (AMP-forming)/AMP-acid ligase II
VLHRDFLLKLLLCPASGMIPYAMIQLFIEWATRTPDAPAFIEPGHTTTYGALLRATRAAAAWLYVCGVRAGDVVALSLDGQPARSARQASLFYGLFYLGAPVLPLYPDAPPATRGPLVARFSARWLIAGGSVDAPAGCARLDPAAFDRESDRWQAAPAPRGDDPARPLRYEFTSGTTGAPKVVLLSGAQYTAIVLNNARYLGWRQGDRLLPVAPVPGKIGLRSMFRVHAAGGALVNVQFPGTMAGLADVVEEFGVTAVRSVPWRLRQILATGLPAGRRPPSLRVLEMAGARIMPEDIRAARASLTANLHINYACSEGGMIAHVVPVDAFDTAPVLIDGMEGEAVDDADRPLPAGAPGRLRFRAPWLPSGYAANEQATASQFVAGWFYPGDYGSIDSTRRVTLLGRSDGAINHGGSKIVPRDIEEVLEQHPDVAEAVVIGVAHPVKGEVPVAFVVPRRSLPARAISEFCAARIEAWRTPALILTVGSIPRSAQGKVLRSHLQDIYDEWARQYLGTGSGSGP